MQKSEEICQEITVLLKSVPIEQRRKRSATSSLPMSDEMIDDKMKILASLLTLADSIYSTCHAKAGTLDDAAINSADEVVGIFVQLWRESGISVTVKVHNIAAHLVNFLRQFRGLAEYDESFMERDHQTGVKNERKSSNVKKYERKAFLYSSWERLQKNPAVKRAIARYESERKKRKVDDPRCVRAAGREAQGKRIKVERREKSKNEWSEKFGNR